MKKLNQWQTQSLPQQHTTMSNSRQQISELLQNATFQEIAGVPVINGFTYVTPCLTVETDRRNSPMYAVALASGMDSLWLFLTRGILQSNMRRDLRNSLAF